MLDDGEQHSRSEQSVRMALLFQFRRHNDVEEQVCVTIDQTGKQSCAAEIDRFDVGGSASLHLRRRANFLDLAVFNQHGGGRNDPVRGSTSRPAFTRVFEAGTSAATCPATKRRT